MIAEKLMRERERERERESEKIVIPWHEDVGLGRVCLLLNLFLSFFLPYFLAGRGSRCGLGVEAHKCDEKRMLGKELGIMFKMLALKILWGVCVCVCVCVCVIE